MYVFIEIHRSDWLVAEEAQSSMQGLEDNVVHQKYIELVSVPILHTSDSLESIFCEVCRTETYGT